MDKETIHFKLQYYSVFKSEIMNFKFAGKWTEF